MMQQARIKIIFLDNDDRCLRSVQFTVDPEMSQSFIPLDFVTSANIPVGDFSLIKPNGTTEKLNVFTKNIFCTSRDVPNVIIRDFAFVASDELGPVLGADFLSLFTYRIQNDKIYVISPR